MSDMKAFAFDCLACFRTFKDWEHCFAHPCATKPTVELPTTPAHSSLPRYKSRFRGVFPLEVEQVPIESNQLLRYRNLTRDDIILHHQAVSYVNPFLRVKLTTAVHTVAEEPVKCMSCFRPFCKRANFTNHKSEAKGPKPCGGGISFS